MNDCYPRLYSIFDFISEILIIFTIIFSPWAFGSVHDWAIWTVTIANYGIGALLLLKWWFRYTTGYLPPRWGKTAAGYSHRFFTYCDIRTKTIAFLTVYILIYVFISIFNVKAKFNYDFSYFEFESKFINWLPKTYDQKSTILSFSIFSGLACAFWGLRDWLLGKTIVEAAYTAKVASSDARKSRFKKYMGDFPIRPRRLLWILSINGGLLGLICIIQRFDGTKNLLWIYERSFDASANQSFGPFGYRSNAASYLNMIIPTTLGFYAWARKNPIYSHKPTSHKDRDAYFIILPFFCIMLTSVAISLSRGGIFVCILLLVFYFCYLLLTISFNSKEVIWQFVMVVGICFILSYSFGFDKFTKRLNPDTMVYKSNVATPYVNDKVVLHCDLSPPPYNRPIILFSISNSLNPKFRKSTLSGKLEKNGFLEVKLNDHEIGSQISMTYTNVTDVLSGNSLKLEIIRGFKGLEVKANNTSLLGFEGKSKLFSPKWSHPIIPAEVTAALNIQHDNGGLIYSGSSLEIKPEVPYGFSAAFKDKVILLNLNRSLDYNKLKSLTSSRDRIYKNAINMANDHFWIGCGLGAWSKVYFLYHNIDEQWEYWAHCDWLEYLTCLGILGFAPGLGLLALTIFGTVTETGLSIPSQIRVGLNLAIAGCLIHAVFDFPLSVLSSTHLFLVLCCLKMNLAKPRV